jgi:ketosteroid isomerase-like protein
MQEAQNTRVVQEAYAAFGRKDVPGILATLDEGIVWKPVMGAGPQVPTSGERRGKPAVADFFRILGESLQFERFEPREFVAQGDTVVALGSYVARTSSGKRFESEWVMVFAFRNGKISQFQEFTDSAALNAAFEAVTVS